MSDYKTAKEEDGHNYTGSHRALVRQNTIEHLNHRIEKLREGIKKVPANKPKIPKDAFFQIWEECEELLKADDELAK